MKNNYLTKLITRIFFTALIIMSFSLFAGQEDVLSSSRPDLWLKIKWPLKASPRAELVVESSNNEEKEIVFVEATADWLNASEPLIKETRRGLYEFRVNKYDDVSGFVPDWNEIYDYAANQNYDFGTILRFENGQLQIIKNARDKARQDYGLSDNQFFIGIIDDKVFYVERDLNVKDSSKNRPFFFSPSQEKIYFFEKFNHDKLYCINVSLKKYVSNNWRINRVQQIFRGNNKDEVIVHTYIDDRQLISIYARGNAIDIKLSLSEAKEIKRK